MIEGMKKLERLGDVVKKAFASLLNLFQKEVAEKFQVKQETLQKSSGLKMQQTEMRHAFEPH